MSGVSGTTKMDCPACGVTITVPMGPSNRTFQCPRCLNVVDPVEAPPVTEAPAVVVPPPRQVELALPAPPPQAAAPLKLSPPPPKLEPLRETQALGQDQGRELDKALRELSLERDSLLRQVEDAQTTIREFTPIIQRVGELESRIWELGTTYLKCLQHLGELEAENERLRRARAPKVDALPVRSRATA